MRFHPKSRASIDHKPGPNIARAAPAVPNKSQTQRSPELVKIFQSSISAMQDPTIGVHKPMLKRIPAPNDSTATIVIFRGGSPHSLTPARMTSTDPTTNRMRSNPVPGHPPANVEYKRRKLRLF